MREVNRNLEECVSREGERIRFLEKTIDCQGHSTLSSQRVLRAPD